jgi:curved DNA-binding protein CbpA
MDQLAGGFARFQQVREAEPVLSDAESRGWHLVSLRGGLAGVDADDPLCLSGDGGEVSPGSTNVMALDPPPSYWYRDLSPTE